MGGRAPQGSSPLDVGFECLSVQQLAGMKSWGVLWFQCGLSVSPKVSCVSSLFPSVATLRV